MIPLFYSLFLMNSTNSDLLVHSALITESDNFVTPVFEDI